MNIKMKNKWLLLTLALAATHAATAQSSTLDDGYRTSAVSDITFEYGETLYIGPNAVWEINGVHVVYSSNIWIAPTAKISGTGTLVIADPATNPFYTVTARPTIIDGNNGNLINLKIEHQNPENIVLDDIADPGFGITNPTGALAAALKIGNNFSFEVDHGDVLLNGNDFIFREPAIVSNFGVNRMVVTGNSIAGHMVMEFNEGPSGSFTFPVGIAEGDYTPATFGSYGIVELNVSVTDYTATTAQIGTPEEGMDRVWHIYGSGSPSTIQLQHNISTNGTSYIDEQAYITRYNGSGQWQPSDRIDYVSPGVHMFTINSSEMLMNFGVPYYATSDQAWFTKKSDAPDLTPSIRLPLNSFATTGSVRRFTAELQELKDAATTENSIEFSVLIPNGYSISFDPSLTSIAVSGGGTLAVQNGNWTLVSTQFSGRKLNFKAKAGIKIDALQKAVLGFTLTRTTSPANSSPVITVNVVDDATKNYDSDDTNNIFTRIVNSL